MLDRLKTLPLTIFLTILIWMYAEGQFSSTQQSDLTIDGVPIWVSGPPDILARYNVEVTPRIVTLRLSGPSNLVEETRKRINSDPATPRFFAFLDLTPQDRSQPPDVSVSRTLRCILPDGFSLQPFPPQASFRLLEKTPPPPATGPATSASQLNFR
jgi:hypothetical protein